MAVVQVPSALRVAVHHPIVSGGFLLLLSLPAFHVLVYFFPLLLSTALCVAALFLGHKVEEAAAGGSKMKLLRAWLMKIRSGHVENQADLADAESSEEDECGGDKGKSESEHELRVRQLERTLRTLSFVSYEGIFDAEGSILDEDQNVETDEANAAAASSSGCNPDIYMDEDQPKDEQSTGESSCSRPEEVDSDPR